MFAKSRLRKSRPLTLSLGCKAPPYVLLHACVRIRRTLQLRAHYSCGGVRLPRRLVRRPHKHHFLSVTTETSPGSRSLVGKETKAQREREINVPLDNKQNSYVNGAFQHYFDGRTAMGCACKYGQQRQYCHFNGTLN